MAQGDRRELWNGFGDGLARAFEFAITPALFGGLGYFLDGALGLRPVLTIALSMFAFIGVTISMWYRYDAEMRQREAETPWGRAAARHSLPAMPAAPEVRP